jgi:hypothetical protein
MIAPSDLPSVGLRGRLFCWRETKYRLTQKGKTQARGKKENKTPRRKKATLDDTKDG